MTQIDAGGHEVPTEHVVPRITAGEMARAASAAAARAVAGRGRTDQEVAGLIEKFGRHADGYLHARVKVGEERFYFHRRYGSWLAPGHVGQAAVLKEPEALLGSVLGREVKFALSAKSQPFDQAVRRERAEREERDRHARSGAKSSEQPGGSGEPAGADRLPEAGDSGRTPEPVSPDGS